MVMMVTALVPMTTFYIVAIMVAMVITALVVVPTLSMVPTPTQGALLQLETAPVWKFAVFNPAMASVPPPAEVNSIFCPPQVLVVGNLQLQHSNLIVTHNICLICIFQ